MSKKSNSKKNIIKPEGFDAISFTESIKKQKSKYIKYVKSRPILNIRDMFSTSAMLYGSKTAFMQKFNPKSPYKEITYSQAYSDMNSLGTALMELGLGGEKIALVGANSYQWAMSYLAITCGVGIVVPLDKELGRESLKELTDVAKVKAVIFTNKYEEDFISIKNSKTSSIEYLINIDSDDHKAGRNQINSWWGLISKGRESLLKGSSEYLDRPVKSEDIASLIFTSGTMGIAKGVLLSHKNIVADLMMSATLVVMKPEDIFFSVLPLNHTYECTGGFLMPLYQGSAIAYCQGLKYISRNMKEVKPTILLAVPAIIEKLQKTIVKNVEKRLRGSQFQKGLKINIKAQKVGLELSDRMFGDLKESFGGRLKIIISGGAPINPSTLKFFRSLGMTAVQGYGLTECSPMACLNPDKKMKDNSAGMLLPNMEVRINNPDDDGNGEICFKGDNVMVGYYENQEATDEVLIDGWFHTGDLGYVDKNNFVYISGRKKNVIIAKNGKNVFPEELEHHLLQIPYIEECMVWGDEKGNKDTAIVASIRVNEEEVSEELGEDYSDEEVMELLWDKIDEINAELPGYKKILRISLRKEEFVKTTTNKIRRFESDNRR